MVFSINGAREIHLLITYTLLRIETYTLFFYENLIFHRVTIFKKYFNFLDSKWENLNDIGRPLKFLRDNDIYVTCIPVHHATGSQYYVQNGPICS